MTDIDPNLKDQFLLEPGIRFFNHGSYGATPRPVLEAQQAFQRRLERQPVRFLGRELDGLLARARAEIASFLGTPADNLVFVSNATFGVNTVARSLDLGPGDEMLTSDHEYGSCDRTWSFFAEKRGFHIRRAPLPSPLPDAERFCDHLWQYVGDRTRVIYLSHITSPTALTLPIETVCRRAREAGILTVIDGAHAPGQLQLDLDQLGADFYTGNHHKWLMAPKGTGFLYARPELQELLEPPVVSWGWQPNPDPGNGSVFHNRFGWLGTDDPTAHLAVPAALHFRVEHRWPEVQARCHALLAEALRAIDAITGLPSLYPSDDAFCQMAVARLPQGTDRETLHQRLYDDHRVEVPISQQGGDLFVRISVQGYNSEDDVSALIDALARLLLV